MPDEKIAFVRLAPGCSFGGSGTLSADRNTLAWSDSIAGAVVVDGFAVIYPSAITFVELEKKRETTALSMAVDDDSGRPSEEDNEGRAPVNLVVAEGSGRRRRGRPKKTTVLK